MQIGCLDGPHPPYRMTAGRKEQFGRRTRRRPAGRTVQERRGTTAKRTGSGWIGRVALIFRAGASRIVEGWRRELRPPVAAAGWNRPPFRLPRRHRRSLDLDPHSRERVAPAGSLLHRSDVARRGESPGARRASRTTATARIPGGRGHSRPRAISRRIRPLRDPSPTVHVSGGSAPVVFGGGRLSRRLRGDLARIGEGGGADRSRYAGAGGAAVPRA